MSNNKLPMNFSTHNELLETEEMLNKVQQSEDAALDQYKAHPKEMKAILKKLAKIKVSATQIRDKLKIHFLGNQE